MLWSKSYNPDTMNPGDKTEEYIVFVKQSLTDKTFVKLSLGNYKGLEAQLKNIYIKRILIKNEEKLSFTYRYKTRDIVKNYSLNEGISNIQDSLSGGFYSATLFTTAFDLTFENLDNKKYILRKHPATRQTVPSAEHDRNKNRLISANEKPYLTELKITDENGRILANSKEKFKQNNQYLEILWPFI